MCACIYVYYKSSPNKSLDSSFVKRENVVYVLMHMTMDIESRDQAKGVCVGKWDRMNYRCLGTLQSSPCMMVLFALILFLLGHFQLDHQIKIKLKNMHPPFS